MIMNDRQFHNVVRLGVEYLKAFYAPTTGYKPGRAIIGPPGEAFGEMLDGMRFTIKALFGEAEQFRFEEAITNETGLRLPYSMPEPDSLP